MRKYLSLMLLALVAASGCSSDERVSDDAIAPTLSSLDASLAKTPLDSFLPSARDSLVLHQAEARIINRCLANLGYTKNPMPAPKAAQKTEPHSEFLVFPVSRAQKHGYSSPEVEIAAESSWDEQSSKTQQDLLGGKVTKYQGKEVPEGGCIRVAAEQITMGTDIPKKITGGGVELEQQEQASPTGLTEAHIEVIRLDAVFATRKDQRVLSMVADWSSCMRHQGYIYGTPEEAANDKKWAGDSVSTAERNTAVADMRCKRDVNYLGHMVSVQSSHEKQLIKKRKRELLQLRSNTKQWVFNAAEALKKHK